ncbi:MAG: hypothetical protein ACR2PT_03995 [Endozoicomonas sp.]
MNREAVKQYLVILAFTPLIMGPTGTVTPPPKESLTEAVQSAQLSIAEQLSYDRPKISYRLTANTTDEWDHYIQQFTDMAEKTHPMIWDKASGRYVPMSDEQLSQLVYREIDLKPEDEEEEEEEEEDDDDDVSGDLEVDLDEYTTTLDQWWGKFKAYTDQEKMPSKIAGELGKYISDQIRFGILNEKIDKLYVMSISEAGEEKILSIIATRKLKLLYGSSYPESQIKQKFREQGAIGRVGEPNRLRALKGVAETAKKAQASAPGIKHSITVEAANERNLVYEKYGFVDDKPDGNNCQ